MESSYRLVREHLRVAAERRKHGYDLRVRPAEFAPGDRVWYYTPRRYQGRSPKWARMYTGPFTVIERLGLVNYRLRKTAHSKPIVVHVDKLRPCFEDGLQDASENAAPNDDMIDAMPDASQNSQRPKRTVQRPARYR